MPERLAIVETEVRQLREETQEINAKLDELLALRNKGAGVFWIVTTIVGSGVIGFIASFLSLFKGH